MSTASSTDNGRYTMGALVEVITQVPPLAWVLVVAVAFGALWRVFNVLHVKPRDFRIESLEREIERLKSAPKDRESREASTTAVPVRRLHSDLPVKPAQPHTPETTLPAALSPEPQPDEGDTLAAGLRSLAIALARLHDDNLTKLQQESVENYFTGKHVVWAATVESVDTARNKTISVQLTDGEDMFWSAIAYFDEAQRADLLKLQKGDRVLVSGQIARVFIGSPVLQQCSITKTPGLIVPK